MEYPMNLRLFDAEGGAESAPTPEADSQTTTGGTPSDSAPAEMPEAMPVLPEQPEALELQPLRDAMRERAANEQIAAWQAEEAEIRMQYPEFDLMQEIHDPLFASLIASPDARTRLSLRAAYEACHVDRVREQAAREAAKAAESNTLHSIRAGMTRPREAGSGTGAAVAPNRIDIARLTRAERRELERRAERGEKITFQEGSWKL